MDTLLFSSIGLWIEDHPIYTIAMNHPRVIQVMLYYSDEPPPKDRQVGTTEDNISDIKSFFRKTQVPVVLSPLDMFKLEENSYRIASDIVRETRKHRSAGVVIDASTGRIPVKLALIRGAELAHKMVKLPITVAMRPQGAEMITYRMTEDSVPEPKLMELLKFLQKNKKMSQTAIASRLGWSGQPEVSRAMKKLREAGLVEGFALTTQGGLVVKYLSNLVTQKD